MKTLIMVSLLVSVVSVFPGGVAAQDTELTATQQEMVKTWTRFMDKVIAMAGDEGYPEDKFDSRPHPDSRSYAEELRHVALVGEAFARRARGEEVDFGPLRAKEKEPATRAERVAELEAARDAFAAVLAEKERPDLIGFIAGMSEHYGKLVTIYRMNGIVPPRSRR